MSLSLSLSLFLSLSLSLSPLSLSLFLPLFLQVMLEEVWTGHTAQKWQALREAKQASKSGRQGLLAIASVSCLREPLDPIGPMPKFRYRGVVHAGEPTSIRKFKERFTESPECESSTITLVTSRDAQAGGKVAAKCRQNGIPELPVANRLSGILQHADGWGACSPATLPMSLVCLPIDLAGQHACYLRESRCDTPMFKSAARHPCNTWITCQWGTRCERVQLQ